jgi:hypothetical protein
VLLVFGHALGTLLLSCLALSIVLAVVLTLYIDLCVDADAYSHHCDGNKSDNNKSAPHRKKVFPTRRKIYTKSVYLSLDEAVDNCGTCCITSYVERCANHVEDTVEGVEQG